MQKVISFCLWGDNPKYTHGAVRNAALAQYIYPDWQSRFYIGDGVPLETVEQLEYYSAELFNMPQGFEGWKGMFARFLPASDESIDVFISRDCDSRLNHREAMVVEDWLKSPKLIHVIRDHPYHTAPIMGGLWGCKKYAIPDLRDMMTKWNMEDRWQTDQEFLRSKIWPQYYHKVLAHDDWNRFPQAMTKSFPVKRLDRQFCGEIFDEIDQPNMEHRNMI